MKKILVSGPSITAKEIEYVTSAVRDAWYENSNMYHQRFENAFARYTGRKYAISLPSCTSALHLSLLALGVGAGDEVIVPDCTWIASAAPIHYVGARTIFADIDPKTWCIDADSFAACITSKTKAVIPVNLYGGMPDYSRILEIANQHGVAVIEDAAESIGSEFAGKKAGAFGVASTFSFHGSKTLTTGEGGMLLTDSDDLYARACYLRDHGRRPGDRLFYNTEIAFKYKMSSMQAALGLAQIERLEELVALKRQIFDWYHVELVDTPGITLNYQPANVVNTYWMVTVVFAPDPWMTKEVVAEELLERGIDSRPFFYPLSSLPAYQDIEGVELAQARNVVSYAISPYGVNLPSGLNLTQETVRFVCSRLKEILGEMRSQTEPSTQSTRAKR